MASNFQLARAGCMLSHQQGFAVQSCNHPIGIKDCRWEVNRARSSGIDVRDMYN